MPRRVHWEEYDRCERCQAERGQRCENTAVRVPYGRQRPYVKTPHQGRRHLTRAATEILREADREE
jgi:hypothetical protein